MAECPGEYRPRGALRIALQTRRVAQQVVAVAVGLRGDAVGVIGHDGVDVLLRQPDQRFGGLVELFGEVQHVVAQDGRAVGSVHVLAGAAGMQQRDVSPAAAIISGSKVITTRALAARLVALLDDLGDAGRDARRDRLVQQTFVGVDNGAGLVDLAKPEEFVGVAIVSRPVCVNAGYAKATRMAAPMQAVNFDMMSPVKIVQDNNRVQ